MGFFIYSHTKKAMKLTLHRFRTEGEARTPDTWFWRPVLYQLSYFRIAGAKVIE